MVRNGCQLSFNTELLFGLPVGHCDRVCFVTLSSDDSVSYCFIKLDVTCYCVNGECDLCHDLSLLSFVVVVRRSSQSERFVYLKNGLTLNHHILTYWIGCHYLLPVGNYREKLSKMPPPMASGRIYSERFKRGSQNFRPLLGTIGFNTLPNMTLLAASCRLHNVIKYCTKVHKNWFDWQSRIIGPLFNLGSPNFMRTSTPT